MTPKISKNRLLITGITLSLAATVSIAMAHEWMAPKNASKIINPIEKNETSISNGKEIFLDNCAACHGEAGKGLPSEDTDLEKGTPNLGKRLLTHSDGDFFWKIQNGKGEMPDFKDDLTTTETWEVIHFIRETSK